MDLVEIPNEGSSRPKPTFMDDLELSAVLHRVISDSRVSSVFELISVLDRSVAELS